MRRERRHLVILVTVVAALGGTSVGASTALADIGIEDFSYAPLGGSPTQTKPESKLWFNDGAWWATLFSPAAGAHRIHRLAGDRPGSTPARRSTRATTRTPTSCGTRPRTSSTSPRTASRRPTPCLARRGGAPVPLQLRRRDRQLRAGRGLPGEHQRREVGVAGHRHGLDRPAVGDLAAGRPRVRQPHRRQRRELGHAVRRAGVDARSTATTSRRSWPSAATGSASCGATSSTGTSSSPCTRTAPATPSGARARSPALAAGRRPRQPERRRRRPGLRRGEDERDRAPSR